ncbi:SurA N-terminal domain-containing protein [Gracilibacillus xinjiangensis]|uniref:peptidylprolyl isomerase n=1 Tax=Gracilibacillus xinjiangensis TaxID=1193282 RepID=A0ABV8WS76_9BACI
MKRLLLFLFSVGIALVLAACNGDDTEDTSETNEENEQTDQNTEETDGQAAAEKQVDPTVTVAEVNGEEIKGEEYNRLYPQVVNYLTQYGQDTSDSEVVKEQVLNELVTQQLITQDAKTQGIEVTDEEVSSEMESIKEQYGEEYKTVLEASGFTEESFQEQLEQDLIRSKYVETQFDTEVTEDEIQAYYDQLSSSSEEDIGKLSEVEDRIREILVQQKRQEQLQPKIEQLRENAEIELLI